LTRLRIIINILFAMCPRKMHNTVISYKQNKYYTNDKNDSLFDSGVHYHREAL
jgi:hypothetical protein